MVERTCELIEGRNYAPKNLGAVAVLGLGKSGEAASRYCADLIGSRVASLTVYAGKETPEAREVAVELLDKGAVVLFNTEEMDGSYDLAIASPGISEFSDFYLNAKRASTEVISEVEFAWRESSVDSTWVAITGTNGKTTTTACTAFLLQHGGRAAQAVGNIGDPCITAVQKGDIDCYVVEVSSYQLASTSKFAPDVAVILNITPDHLSWHHGFENYAAAKEKVFANVKKAVVLCATDEETRKIVKHLKSSADKLTYDYVPLGTAAGITNSMREACGSKNAAYIQDNALVIDFDGDKHALGTLSQLQIKGEHNAINALAAACSAYLVGVSAESIAQSLSTFQPLEHRIEPCATVAGVACYNDSKATNVDATLKALCAFDPAKPIILLGGRDKGTALDELVEQAEEHCKAVICFGEAGPRFAEAFASSDIPHPLVGTLEDALDAALEMATTGDVVALSPACASFDEFSCYQERGKMFKQLVYERSRLRGK